jgi:hypothetical protein
LVTSVIALDASARYYDSDGRLHVRVSHISKANVGDYRGSEIPDAEALGLDSNRIYKLLRDPAELARAAPTFNNLQLLIRHVPVTADEPSREHTVGSTGTDAVFLNPYLDNSLVVWDGEAIAAIETKEQCQLSAAYRYTADMTPGRYMGTSYDGVMRDIRGNHVALVKAGRAGDDVVVMDAALSEEKSMKTRRVTLSPRAAVAKGALIAYLLPRLAQDQQLPDLNFLAGVNSKNWAKSAPAIATRVVEVSKGRLAMDADLKDVSALLDHFKGEDPDAGPGGVGRPEDAEVPAEDPTVVASDPDDPEERKVVADDDIEGKLRELLQGKLDDSDLEMVLKLVRPEEAPVRPVAVGSERDDDDDDDGDVNDDAALPPALAANAGVPMGKKEDKDDKDEPMIKKPAMDAAIKLATDEAVQRAVKATRQEMRSLAEAERFVRPWVGEVMAMDSAEDVFAFALDKLGVQTKGVHPSAYRAMLTLVRKPGEGQARVAQDGALRPDKGFAERFPNAGRVRVMG